MTAATSAPMAARNGASSTFSSRLQAKHRKRSVRVDGGRPVAGEVLGGRKQSLLPSPDNERYSQTTHSFRILAIGTRVDDRIRRVHVEA